MRGFTRQTRGPSVDQLWHGAGRMFKGLWYRFEFPLTLSHAIHVIYIPVTSTIPNTSEELETPRRVVQIGLGKTNLKVK